MNRSEFYPFVDRQYADGLKFFFVSKGQRDIVKAVEYTYLQNRGYQKIYNLGFGDYDIPNDTILDEINTNNGDAYKVFHTVLRTIPLFFERYPETILMVQGSDSTPEFLKHCLEICTKSCHSRCKKFNQRISVYRNFVNKHYDELTKEYILYGGRKNGGKIRVEKYRVNEPYTVLLFESNFVLSGGVMEPEEAIAIMKKKEKTSAALSETELLAMVAEKLKGRVLFPRLVENAKKTLQKAEFVFE